MIAVDKMAIGVLAAATESGVSAEDVMDRSKTGPLHVRIVRARRAVLLAMRKHGFKRAPLARYAARLGWWGTAGSAITALKAAEKSGEMDLLMCISAYEAMFGEPETEPDPTPPAARQAKPKAKPVEAFTAASTRKHFPVSRRARLSVIDERPSARNKAPRMADLRRLRKTAKGSYPVAQDDHRAIEQARAAIRGFAVHHPDWGLAALALACSTRTGLVPASSFVRAALDPLNQLHKVAS